MLPDEPEPDLFDPSLFTAFALIATRRAIEDCARARDEGLRQAAFQEVRRLWPELTWSHREVAIRWAARLLTDQPDCVAELEDRRWES